MSRMIIEIDATPWDDEYLEAEMDLSDMDKVMDTLQTSSIHIAKLARLLTVARERGQTESSILPDNRSSLNVGHASALMRRIATMMKVAKMPNGTSREIRAFVLPVSERVNDGDDAGDYQAEIIEDDEPRLAASDDSLAVDRAVSYLLNRVPGYIMGRLEIIAANDPQRLSGLVAELHDRIDGLVMQLL